MPKNNQKLGWILFVSALGMMSGLMADDIRKLSAWNQVTYPEFVASIMTHFASVVTAFIGGKIMPLKRNISSRTRRDDSQS